MATAISEKYGFIFTHIPKTGGTSLFSHRSWLRELPEFNNIKLASGHVRLSRLKVDIEKYYKFTIVRNPWDRVISLWLTRKELHIKFDGYLSRLLDQKESIYFFATQSFWISDDEGKLLVDKVYRYEDYENAAKEIYIKFMGIRLTKIPRLRKTKRMRDYRRYYKNSSQVDLVSKLYKEDIENFNYDF